MAPAAHRQFACREQVSGVSTFDGRRDFVDVDQIVDERDRL